MDNKKLGTIDTWLMPLRKVRMDNAKAIEGLDGAAKARKMVDLNVQASVDVLRSNPDVIEAIKERGLTVQGLVYDLASGELVPVDSTSNHEDADQEHRHGAFKIA